MAVTVEASGTAKSPALARLIAGVREIVRTQPEAQRAGPAVAELLQPLLGTDDFLSCEQLAPATCDYCQHVLHVEEDGSFSVVALVWLPGQATPIHDHVSWCVVGVHQGEEHESVYRLAGENGDAHLILSGQHVNPRGAVAALVPPGDIHRVANASSGVAVSLHVYGANIGALGSSIRRSYDLEVRGPGS